MIHIFIGCYRVVGSGWANDIDQEGTGEIKVKIKYLYKKVFISRGLYLLLWIV